MGVKTESIRSKWDICFKDNPVIIRDLRTRMRGIAIYWLLAGYLGVAAIVVANVYYASVDWGAHITISMLEPIGGDMFSALTWTQTIVLLVVIPGITAPSISREYEKKTIEMVALTRLDSFQFALGKVGSAFFYCMLLIVTGLPLAGICLIFGGISPEEIAITYVLMISFSFMFCTFGVYLSALLGKTIGVVLTFYGFLVLYSIMFAKYGYMDYYVRSYAGSRWTALMLPVWTQSHGLDNLIVSGIKIPLSLLTVVLQVLAGLVFFYAAAGKIRHWKRESALGLRVFLIMLLALTSFFSMTSYNAPMIWTSVISPTAYPLLIAFVVVPLAIIFGSGPFKKQANQHMLNYIISLKSMFKANISGALAYMTLVTIVCYSLAAFSHNLRFTLILTKSDYWIWIVKQGVMLLAFVWMAVSNSVFCSAIFKNRIVASGVSVASLASIALAFMSLLPNEIISGNNEMQYSALYPTATPVAVPALLWPNDRFIYGVAFICFATAGLFLLFTESVQKHYKGVVE